MFKKYIDREFTIACIVFVALLSMLVLFCHAVGKRSDEEKARLDKAVVLTPALCEQKCKPLSVSFYTHGFVILDHGVKNQETVCYSGGYNCSDSYEKACVCGSDTLTKNYK